MTKPTAIDTVRRRRMAFGEKTALMPMAAVPARFLIISMTTFEMKALA